MSSFICEHCGAEIMDSPIGYLTACPHYPMEALNRQPKDWLTELLIGDSARASAQMSIRGEKIKDRPPLDDWMVICATRYALGRSSCAPGEVAHYLIWHWDKLQPKTRAVIVQDIEEAMVSGQYGMDMDRAEWMQVLERARL